MIYKILKHCKPYFFLSLLCFALYLPGISTIPLDDRDSAHFVQATRQMLETGNYFQIRFQDTTRYQKPPGINWLQALSVKAFSTPQSNAVWPYRLPSVVGGWLAVLLTFAFARRFCGQPVAIIAAIALASTVLLTIESHLAVIDTSLLSAVVLMQGALWIIYDQIRQGKKVHWQWPLLFFLSMSYGFLLKGVTPLVGFLTLITLSIIDRTTAYCKAVRLPWGILLLLFTSGTWLVGVSLAEHSNYLLEMLHRDLLPKLAGGHESHGAPFGTHFFLLLLTFWPMSLFLWPLCIRTWKHRAEPIERFLLAWIIPVWLFFECMPTKLPQYILPIFPALAILVAYAILDSSNQNNQNSKITRILIMGWGCFSLIFASAFIIIQHALHVPIHLFSASVWATLMLIITSITAIIFFLASKKQALPKAFTILILGNLLISAIVYQYLLPQLTPLWSSQMIANDLERVIPGKINAQHPLSVIEYSEPSLVFLLGTHAVKASDISNYIRDYQQDPIRFRYLLIDSTFQAAFIAAHVTATQIDTITAFNYSKNRWITLILYQIS